MPYYHKAGKFPEKRHTQFRKPNGELYAEELVSTEGFSSIYSLVYHSHPPTLVKHIGEPIDVAPKAAIANNMQNRSFITFKTEAKDDFLESRVVQLYNSDLYMAVAAPKESMSTYFYKNADADELLFIHKGKGVLKTFMGNISFEYGDYLIIPRGMIYQLHFETEANRLFIVESFGPIRYPKRYMSKLGAG